MNFSVVIPLYNKAYSIQRCIDSVLNQTTKSFEIIIVNDGSTDSSMEIIEENYNNLLDGENFKLITQDNKGVSVARNTGIENSSYDYICFLDADDEWLPSFLETISLLVRDYPSADLYSLAHVINKAGSGIKKAKHGLPDNFRGYVSDFFKASSKGSVVKSSKMCVKKSSILEFGGFPIGVVAGEDLYVWIKLALKGRVACDMSYLAVIHQEEDDSRRARKNSVPYPLIYFSQNKVIERASSLNLYLFSIFFKHFISSILSCRFKEAYLRIYYYVRMFL
jgi:glycosyltransferase involved in cell wall biosynthesis